MSVDNAVNQRDLEVKWINALVPADMRENWFKYESTFRMFGEVGSMYVIWQHTPEGLKILDYIKLEGMYLDPSTGAKLIFSDKFGVKHEVSHTPLKISGVYFWVPFFCDFRYSPKDYTQPLSARTVRIAFCTKTKTNKNTKLTVNHRYISTWASFHKENPAKRNS